MRLVRPYGCALRWGVGLWWDFEWGNKCVGWVEKVMRGVGEGVTMGLAKGREGQKRSQQAQDSHEQVYAELSFASYAWCGRV